MQNCDTKCCVFLYMCVWQVCMRRVCAYGAGACARGSGPAAFPLAMCGSRPRLRWRPRLSDNNTLVKTVTPKQDTLTPTHTHEHTHTRTHTQAHTHVHTHTLTHTQTHTHGTQKKTKTLASQSERLDARPPETTTTTLDEPKPGAPQWSRGSLPFTERPTHTLERLECPLNVLWSAL